MNTLSNNISRSPILASSLYSANANANTAFNYPMLSPFIGGHHAITSGANDDTCATAIIDDCQLISNDFDDIVAYTSSAISSSDDDSVHYDEECIATHPYVKSLRNYQTQVFRPVSANDIISNMSAHNNNSCSRTTTFHNHENTNSTCPSPSSISSSSSSSVSIKSEPFKDIISVIEKQVNYYKDQNDLMYNINNAYFQYFCNNIAFATENQKKIKQLESLLNDFKGVGCQLKNITDQSNYLNKNINHG